MCGTSAAWTESTVASVVIVASWSEGESDQPAGDGLQAASAMARTGDPGAASVKAGLLLPRDAPGSGSGRSSA